MLRKTFGIMLTLLFAIFLMLGSAFSQTESVINGQLVSLLDTVDGPVEVIVTFEGDGAPTESQLQLLEDVGITQGITLHSLPIAGIIATASQVEQIAASPYVRSVVYNEKVTYENHDSTQLTGVNDVRTDSDFIRNNNGFPITGHGIGVVINDSGVDGTHRDHELGRNLVQNVQGATNLNALSSLLPVTYVENVPNTDTDSGHGTHVAGIVGGTGAMSSGLYEGVAPGANLIGYGSGAGVAILDTLGAFDYALTHQYEYNIRVVTNSWGTTSDTGTDFDPNHPINVATKACYDRGIAVVFSAGNSGSADDTITGNYKKAPWVITVAAGDKHGELASFSSRGKDKEGTVIVDGDVWTWSDRPTVTAPGVDIISTIPLSVLYPLGVSSDISPAHQPFYGQMSGTSMAAPHVAGIIALMLEVDPNLDPLDIKYIIENTATPMEGYELWEVGAGYVNAYDAVKHVMDNR